MSWAECYFSSCKGYFVACSCHYGINTDIICLYVSRAHDFSVDYFDDRTVIICDQVCFATYCYMILHSVSFPLPISLPHQVLILISVILLVSMQCEKEYHVGCLRGDGRCDLKVSILQNSAVF